MKRVSHWTAQNDEAFAHALAFDFIAQIEKRMDMMELSQSKLAGKLGVSEGAVSHVLNNPQNLTLKTVARYCRALGIKVSLATYDEAEQAERSGLVPGEILATCWDRAGRPQNFEDLEVTTVGTGSTSHIYDPLAAGSIGVFGESNNVVVVNTGGRFAIVEGLAALSVKALHAGGR